MRHRVGGLFLVVAALLAAGSPARALPAGMPALPLPQADDHVIPVVAFTFVPPRVTIPAGDTLTLSNLDLDIHGLRSVAVDEDGKPLFDTGFPGVAPSTSAPVKGVNLLHAGTYDFYCNFHANLPTMHGILTIA